jgi:putative transposase
LQSRNGGLKDHAETEVYDRGDYSQAARGRRHEWPGQDGRRGLQAAGITDKTYFRWRKSHGGLRIDQAKRMKELETENARLKKAVAELTIDKIILKEVAEGKF